MSKILKHQHHLIRFDCGLCDQNRILWDSPLSSVFSNVSKQTVTQTQLNIPISISTYISEICSCDGILCVTLDGGRSVVLCNPSLRKYITLPPLENNRKREVQSSFFSFGYDHFNDVYKVIAISCVKDNNNVVDVYTLGTNYWRSIQDFPYSSCYTRQPGVFVRGTVNWLANEEVSNSSYCCVIVSLDLKTELYQKIYSPDLKTELYKEIWMFRDCLCIFASSNMLLDVWIMKEYGIKESWTKLYNVYLGNQLGYLKTVYISDDDQVLCRLYDLMTSKLTLVVYNSKNGNVKIRKIQHNNIWMDPKVYVESLISLPCSY